ncbi:Protein PRMN-1 [Aphelenchoides avenae]|nr:Protein PRMN-1 [Aphelenchus avenae]
MNNLFDKYAGQFRTVLHEILANDTAGASTEDQEAQRMVLNVRAEADGYLDLVNVTLQTDVLSCAPVREITSQSVSMTCGYILDPFNGIWLALVICILATILLAFVSTCASKAYRKYEYRSGPRVVEVFSAWDEPIVYESTEKPPTRVTRPRIRLFRPFQRHGGRRNEKDVEVWRL